MCRFSTAAIRRICWEILDVRATTAEAFGSTLGNVLGILAELLGLAIALVDAQRRLVTATQQLQVAQTTQLPMLEDLMHQMLSPLRNALTQLATVESLAGPASSPDAAALRTAAIIARGHVRRSYRVGLAGRVFRDLRVHQRIIQPRGSRPLGILDVQEALIRLVDDQQLVSDPLQEHKFLFDPTDLVGTYQDDIVGDPNLFEQMVSNLLDNADKYSFKGTAITVRGERTRDRMRFVLAVENEGYPIARDEVRLIRQRGQRGREASLRIAEGQGIGLWIVDELIKSFGGILEVSPALRRGQPHVFRLLFPREGG